MWSVSVCPGLPWLVVCTLSHFLPCCSSCLGNSGKSGHFCASGLPDQLDLCHFVVARAADVRVLVPQQSHDQLRLQPQRSRTNRGAQGPQAARCDCVQAAYREGEDGRQRQLYVLAQQCRSRIELRARPAR